MATTPESYRADLDLAAKGLGELSTKFKETKDQYLDNAKALKDLSEITKKYGEMGNNLRANMAKDAETLIKLAKETRDYQKAEEQLRNVIERNVNVVKNYQKAYESLNGILKTVTGTAMGAVAAFGVQKITWDGLVKTSLEYNKTLFELSRIQNVSGRGFKDLGSTLEYVRKETKMSQMEFLNLSNAIMKTAVGVKPSLENVAKMLKTWGDQMGYDYEAGKNLFASMQQFPALFKSMQAGLEGVDNINKKKGAATDAEKRHNDVLKTQTLLLAQIGQVSSEEFDKAAQALTPLTEQEKEYSELLKQRAELTKSVGDLQVDLAKKFEPIQKELLKTATDVVEKMAEHKNAVAGIGAAAIGMVGLASATRTVQLAMTALKVSGGPAFLAIAGVATAIGLIGAKMFEWKENEHKASEAAKDLANATALQVNMKKQVAGLNATQAQEYNKLMSAAKGENDTIKETAAHHQNAYQAVTRQGGTVALLYKQYQETLATVQKYEAAIDKSNSAMKNLVSTTEQFGGLAEEAYQAVVNLSEIDIANRAEAAAAAYAKIVKLLEGKVELDIDANPEQAKRALTAIAADIKNISGTDEERKNIVGAITDYLTEENAIITKQAHLVQGRIDQDTMHMRQQEKFTSLYEARLDTERKLMESAQFGMGASVSMMKQQVDLAYKMMETYAADDKHMQKRIMSWGSINSSQLKAIQNAKTQAEAEKIISGAHLKSKEEYDYLNAYAAKHQEISKKIMDQQQKIYDLTKDIREGYLDAMREMAVGAGEFTKIIGTQEMGVTQLMDVVNGIAGAGTMNTFKLGGVQSAESVAAGVGTDVAGRYTMAGAQFESSGATEAKNSRIRGYRESVDEATKVMQGDLSGKRSTIGGMNSPMAEKSLGEAREQGTVMGEIIADEMVTAWNNSSKSTRQFTQQGFGMNPTITAPGRVAGSDNPSLIQSHGANVGAWGGQIANMGNAPAPAGNVGTPAGILPSVRKMMEEDNKLLDKALRTKLKIQEVDLKSLQTTKSLAEAQAVVEKILSTQPKSVERKSNEYDKLMTYAAHHASTVSRLEQVGDPMAGATVTGRAGTSTFYKGMTSGKTSHGLGGGVKKSVSHPKGTSAMDIYTAEDWERLSRLTNLADTQLTTNQEGLGHKQKLLEKSKAMDHAKKEAEKAIAAMTNAPEQKRSRFENATAGAAGIMGTLFGMGKKVAGGAIGLYGAIADPNQPSISAGIPKWAKGDVGDEGMRWAGLDPDLKSRTKENEQKAAMAVSEYKIRKEEARAFNRGQDPNTKDIESSIEGSRSAIESARISREKTAEEYYASKLGSVSSPELTVSEKAAERGVREPPSLSDEYKGGINVKGKSAPAKMAKAQTMAMLRGKLAEGTMSKEDFDKEMSAANKAVSETVGQVTKVAKVGGLDTPSAVRRGKTGGIAHEMTEHLKGSSRAIKELGGSDFSMKGGHAKSTFEGGDSTYRKNIASGGMDVQSVQRAASKLRAEVSEKKEAEQKADEALFKKYGIKPSPEVTDAAKEAQKVQKGAAPAQETQKSAEQATAAKKTAAPAIMEAGRGRSREQKDSASESMQAAYSAAAASGQREITGGGEGGGGGGGTATLVITLDKGLIGELTGKLNDIHTALGQGSSRKAG